LTDTVSHTIEGVAKASYGKLVACLAARWRDVAAAEDGLSHAFSAALRAWADTGVPANPEGWLVSVAHRFLIDQARQRRLRTRIEPEVADTLFSSDEPMSFPDHRLPLLFVCAHPAIAMEARAPLMLQVVLGLDAATIAPAFLITPAAMSQRLVRAKNKIRDAGIAFVLPAKDEFAERLEPVLAAIYAAYGTGWEDATGADPRTCGLSAEAIKIGRAMVELLPQSAEPRGLLALMLHCEARRFSRRDGEGRYVPLSEQDPRHWDAALIDEAESELAAAAKIGARLPARFQIEAAIQSVHAARRFTGRVDWRALERLYGKLNQLTSSLGARVGHAAVLAESEGAVAGLASLDELAALEAEWVNDYQPYWAVRAHILHVLGRFEESAEARRIALALSKDPAVKAFLQQSAASRQGGLGG
jgi:predicted RNA polymerase sigma factor